MTLRRRTAAAAAMLAAVALAGCSSESTSISDQARQGDNKGFIAGDGTIEKLSPGDRKAALTLSGTQLNGGTWNLQQASGKVVVLNVWGAWCGPCQRELPQLQKAWKGFQTAGKPVVMMGLNQRDSVAAAQATTKRFGITYPSLRDDGGRTLLALQGKAATFPTTLVLDPQGRIAARVSGETTEATLRGLVDDVIKEGSSS